MEFLSNILPESIVIEREAEKVRKKFQAFKAGSLDEQTLFLADIDSADPNSPVFVYIGQRKIAYEKLLGKMNRDMKSEVTQEEPQAYEYFVQNDDIGSIAHTKNIDTYLKTINPMLPQGLKVYTEIAGLNGSKPGEKRALVKEVYCGYEEDKDTGAEVEVILAERWVARRRHEDETPTKGTRIKLRSMGALFNERKAAQNREQRRPPGF